MAAIGLITQTNRPEILKVLNEINGFCLSDGHRLILEAQAAEKLGWPGESLELKDLLKIVNPIVTLGGDGTLIRIARFAAESDSVIVGVNFETLGFLTEISPNEAVNAIKSVIEGKAELATRAMLRVEVHRQGESAFICRGVNDAVLRSDRQVLVELDVDMEGEDMLRLRADGLILSTPTGSTAYSLAAGGPILYPTLSTILLTPICPHSLTNRPIVLPLDTKLGIQVPIHEHFLSLTVDGQEYFKLEPADRIVVSKARSTIKFVCSPSKNYFEILRTKLNWAVPNKS